MKRALLLILCCWYGTCFGNMAEPIDYGTVGASPYISRFVDILHEDISITPGSEFKFAEFNIEYHIRSSADSLLIPLLFYAYDIVGDFEVWVDGKAIATGFMDWSEAEIEQFEANGLTGIFSDTRTSLENPIQIGEQRDADVSMDELRFFEAPISMGEHTIRVRYKAAAWKDRWEWVANYQFRYSLSPAKYWRSFGTLTVKVDPTLFSKPCTLAIGNAAPRPVNGQSEWKFDSLPGEILVLTFQPEVSDTAQFLIDLGPFNLALIAGLCLILIELWLMVRWRRRNPAKNNSKVALLCGIIFPILFGIIWLFSYDLIDYVIGPHASQTHGYSFLLVVFIPFIIIVHLPALILIDRYLLRKK